MGRPRRPEIEHAAVIAAAGTTGTARARAARLARRVAVAAVAAVDETEEPVIGMLRTLIGDPVALLARDPAIDTGAMVRAERARRCEARGGRRLPEAAWPAEDRDTVRVVAAQLERRYRRMLNGT
ncbi:MAG: hypothetical protein DI530_12240 [Sphingomonas sp.]|uniref:hypothetical protein n=1 Tax=Sphingomonas sp. TaxID=28214 RepID=UPI000DBBCBD4|nr:hypothetical protein [Sphingomonas sp.]PZU77754.1 MAG: hypothetical protein DI530_12240 [Sphingomonas sp.]